MFAPAAKGAPFAGIPPELADRARRVLDREPEHQPEPPAFSHRRPPEPRFTLRHFLAPSAGALAVALALVMAETVTLIAGPLLVEAGVDHGITPGDFRALVGIGAVYLGVIVANALLGWIRGSWTVRVGESLMERLRLRVFTHLERLSLSYFEQEKAGVVLTRMTSDVENLTTLFQEGLVQMAVQVLTVVTVAAIVLRADLLLGGIILGGLLPTLVLATLWYRRRSSAAYDEVRDRVADVLSDLSETLSGIRTVTAHDRAERNATHHEDLVDTYRGANLVTARLGAWFGSVGDTLGVLSQVVVLGVGGVLVRDGRMSLGTLFAFLLYLNLLFAPVQQLVQLYTVYQQGRASVAKLADLLATEPDVAEAADAVELPRIEGRIELRGVRFAYRAGRDGADVDSTTGPGTASRFGTPVLDALDLQVDAGETLAIVGPTGAGKSTVAKLVARFYDPIEGAVCLDGVDLRTVTLDSLRRQLGVVPQEPFLFHGTVRDNLLFARPDADDDELRDACRAVGITELIDRLPAGLDTPVHERGVSLSAGERQLLSLGRAFLARPRVLILDEATSNLDPAAEARIERALDVLLEGRTAVVIAHRLATARRADRIAVIDRPSDGGGAKVLELGTHEALVRLGGRYASMYATWERHLGDSSSRPG
jgi:ATP-binding cassette subfamily B protein